MLTIDFETRSACPLSDTGAWRYAEDPTTELLCMAFAFGQGPVRLWHSRSECDYPSDNLGEVFEYLKAGGLVEAHNASFEYAIWQSICVPKLGWPDVPISQWRCSAAKAAAHGLPRSLAGATMALQLEVQKDLEGAAVMKKGAKPLKPLASQLPGKGLLIPPSSENGYHYQFIPADTPKGSAPTTLPHVWYEDFPRLFDYCKVDVAAERALSEALADLTPAEQEVFAVDMAINARGIPVDREGAVQALRIAEAEKAVLGAELLKLTGGQVAKGSQRAKMLAWFAQMGYPQPDTTAHTLKALAQDDAAPAAVRQAAEVTRKMGASSIAKYEAVVNWANPTDNRIRGSLLYHGAATGRWSGMGLQPHNFARGTVKNANRFWPDIHEGDRDWLESMAGEGQVIPVLASALRGVIQASPGQALVAADFAAIEARTLAWLAGDRVMQDTFAAGKCVYMAMASEIYGYPVVDKEKQAAERHIGKQAILGLGYGMGAPKFRDTVRLSGVGMSEEFAKRVVEIYRQARKAVANFWYEAERAAVSAVQQPMQVFQCAGGKVRWRYDGAFFLCCKLPSGRMIRYPAPAIKVVETPWGEPKATLQYGKAKLGQAGLWPEATYGGKLVENINQAVARDLMAAALVRIEKTGIYKPFMTVHDELVAEVPEPHDKAEAQALVKRLETLMAETPDWAKGCVVKAEGWLDTRYRK